MQAIIPRGNLTMRASRFTVCSSLLILLPMAPNQGRSEQGAKVNPLTLDVPAKEARYLLLEFPAKHKALLSIKSEKDGDVDLFVVDPLGKTVASDVTVGKDAKVEFTTKDEPQVMLVKIANLGPNGNRCTLEHNVKPAGATAQPLLKLAAGEKHACFQYHHMGNVATLKTGFKANVSLAVHDVDGVKIASDPKGNFAAWEIKGPKIVRVTLTNHGKEEASARQFPGALELVPVSMPAFDLEQGAKKAFDIDFRTESVAAVWIASDKNSDVDLIVQDAVGKEVISDITVGKDCFIGFMPRATGTYRVTVINQGPGANRCVLKHTGTTPK
jgi:hypothetical protein